MKSVFIVVDTTKYVGDACQSSSRKRPRTQRAATSATTLDIEHILNTTLKSGISHLFLHSFCISHNFISLCK